MPAFTAEVREIPMALAVEIPDEVLDALGGVRVPIEVTLAGSIFRTTTYTRGGRTYVRLNRAVAARTGVAAGDVHELQVARDLAPRAVAAPDEIAAAFTDDPTLAESWAGLAPSHQKEYAEWVTSAKRADTRVRRAERAVERLREGAKSPR